MTLNNKRFEIPYEGFGLTHTPHCVSTADCLKSLNVFERDGLSTTDFQNRLAKFGRNILPEPPVKSVFKLVIEQFQDRLVQILLGVAFFSAIIAVFEHDLHAMLEPVIILAILALNAIVGIFQSMSAENSLDALKKLQPSAACVLRDGSWNDSLPTELIVPGDIIYLRVGDKVPADGRIIQLKTNTCNTDEASLTGESASVSKYTEPVAIDAAMSERNNMVRIYLQHVEVFLYL